MNLIYSVPHTGTRFTMALLDYLGVPYLQRHAGQDIPKFDRAVTPVRDPAVQFLSLRKRSERKPFEKLLTECIDSWESFTQELTTLDFLQLKIDGVIDFQNPDFSPLYEVAEYFGSNVNPEGFGWPTVHAYKGVPTSIYSFNSISEPERKIIFDALSPYREIYGYNINNLD